MLILDERSSVPLWRSRAPEPDAVFGFSTRRGGVSAAPYESLNLGLSTADDQERVTENRRRMLVALDLDPGRLATAGQVHGARVVEVDRPGHTPQCDALVTAVPGLALAVTAADCAPLVLHAPGWVAAAHAGWRGTADGLPGAVLDVLRRRAGVDAAGVRVAIGPCIRGCCYEIGPDVARRFPASAVTLVRSRHHLDLSTAIRVQLMEAGVAASALTDASACTACAPEWYFSHRRDAGLTGRHWGVVARRGDASSRPSPGRSGRGV
jgi:hypothetical protein